MRQKRPITPVPIRMGLVSPELKRFAQDLYAELSYTPRRDELGSVEAGPTALETQGAKIGRLARKWIKDPFIEGGRAIQAAQRGEVPRALGSLNLVAGAIAGGMATPGPRNSVGMITGPWKKESLTPVAALKQARVLRDQLRSWLINKEPFPAPPQQLYRGIPEGTTITKPTTGYTHVTPWPDIASKGGKFGGINDVYSATASPSTRYYRGGSLAGDPLEPSKINTAQGEDWINILQKAKRIYYKQLKRESREVKKYGFPKEVAAEKAADTAVQAIRMATFEADAAGNPGVWTGKKVPKKLAREIPALRRNPK